MQNKKSVLGILSLGAALIFAPASFAQDSHAAPGGPVVNASNASTQNDHNSGASSAGAHDAVHGTEHVSSATPSNSDAHNYKAEGGDDYGWFGLLGLAGLVGLAGRKSDVQIIERRNAHDHAGH